MSASTPALVSVMIAVYNNAAYLGEAIESVLGQSYEPVELVVVDDGSDDGSGDVAKSYLPKVRYEFHDRRGIGASRNRALELSSGDYLAFLDADDRYLPHTVERQMATFEAHPSLDVVFASVREFISPELDDEAKARLRPPAEQIAGRLPTNMLCRRHAFFRVGHFRTDLKRGTTLDWSARAMERQLVSQLLPDVLFERRLHSENNGIRERASTNDYVRVLKAAIDRRRAMGTGPGGGAIGDPAGERSTGG